MLNHCYLFIVVSRLNNTYIGTRHPVVVVTVPYGKLYYCVRVFHFPHIYIYTIYIYVNSLRNYNIIQIMKFVHNQRHVTKYGRGYRFSYFSTVSFVFLLQSLKSLGH